MKSITVLVLALLFGCLAAGCTTGNGVWTTKDSWYTGFPSRAPWNDEEHHEIARERILPVSDGRLKEAITLLEHTDILAIDVAGARLLVGTPDLDPDKFLGEDTKGIELKPYLVRAVVLFEGTGGFSAYWKDAALWIHHGCLGHGPAPMGRRPLVIFLPKEPVAIYNDVSMAE